jgi:hypothetical protein
MGQEDAVDGMKGFPSHPQFQPPGGQSGDLGGQPRGPPGGTLELGLGFKPPPPPPRVKPAPVLVSSSVNEKEKSFMVSTDTNVRQGESSFSSSTVDFNHDSDSGVHGNEDRMNDMNENKKVDINRRKDMNENKKVDTKIEIKDDQQQKNIEENDLFGDGEEEEEIFMPLRWALEDPLVLVSRRLAGSELFQRVLTLRGTGAVTGEKEEKEEPEKSSAEKDAKGEIELGGEAESKADNEDEDSSALDRMFASVIDSQLQGLESDLEDNDQGAAALSVDDFFGTLQGWFSLLATKSTQYLFSSIFIQLVVNVAV